MDDKLMQAIETIICAAMMQRSGARAIGTFMILTADTKYLGGDYVRKEKNKCKPSLF